VRTSRFRYIAVLLTLLLATSEALAGVTITGSNGIATTGVDGVGF
jgi:hypothetical protein